MRLYVHIGHTYIQVPVVNGVTAFLGEYIHILFKFESFSLNISDEIETKQTDD